MVSNNNKQALRIVHSYYKSSFNTLPDGSFSILSIIEISRLWLLRYENSLTPLGDVLKLDSPATYNLRTYKETYSRNLKQ